MNLFENCVMSKIASFFNSLYTCPHNSGVFKIMFLYADVLILLIDLLMYSTQSIFKVLSFG